MSDATPLDQHLQNTTQKQVEVALTNLFGSESSIKAAYKQALGKGGSLETEGESLAQQIERRITTILCLGDVALTPADSVNVFREFQQATSLDGFINATLFKLIDQSVYMAKLKQVQELLEAESVDFNSLSTLASNSGQIDLQGLINLNGFTLFRSEANETVADIHFIGGLKDEDKRKLVKAVRDSAASIQGLPNSQDPVFYLVGAATALTSDSGMHDILLRFLGGESLPNIYAPLDEKIFEIDEQTGLIRLKMADNIPESLRGLVVCDVRRLILESVRGTLLNTAKPGEIPLLEQGILHNRKIQLGASIIDLRPKPAVEL